MDRQWGLDNREAALGLSNGCGVDLDVRRREVAAKPCRPSLPPTPLEVPPWLGCVISTSAPPMAGGPLLG